MARKISALGHDSFKRILGHPFSTYTKFSEKLTFLTPWCAHICVHVPDTHIYVCVSGGKKCWFFRKFYVGTFLFIWQPGRDKKQDGTINEIIKLQSFFHKFVITFIWRRNVFHPVSAWKDLTCSMQNPCIAKIIFSI